MIRRQPFKIRLESSAANCGSIDQNDFVTSSSRHQLEDTSNSLRVQNETFRTQETPKNEQESNLSNNEMRKLAQDKPEHVYENSIVLGTYLSMSMEPSVISDKNSHEMQQNISHDPHMGQKLQLPQQQTPTRKNIITLPHLLNRANGTPSKTPIIIREKIDSSALNGNVSTIIPQSPSHSIQPSQVRSQTQISSVMTTTTTTSVASSLDNNNNNRASLSPSANSSSVSSASPSSNSSSSSSTSNSSSNSSSSSSTTTSIIVKQIEQNQLTSNQLESDSIKKSLSYFETNKNNLNAQTTLNERNANKMKKSEDLNSTSPLITIVQSPSQNQISNDSLPSVQERIEQFQQISRQRQLTAQNQNINGKTQTTPITNGVNKGQTLFNRIAASNNQPINSLGDQQSKQPEQQQQSKESPRIVKVLASATGTQSTNSTPTIINVENLKPSSINRNSQPTIIVLQKEFVNNSNSPISTTPSVQFVDQHSSSSPQNNLKFKEKVEIINQKMNEQYNGNYIQHINITPVQQSFAQVHQSQTNNQHQQQTVKYVSNENLSANQSQSMNKTPTQAVNRIRFSDNTHLAEQIKANNLNRNQFMNNLIELQSIIMNNNSSNSIDCLTSNLADSPINQSLVNSPTNQVDEIPAKEPDLNKKPIKSALKKEQLKVSLENDSVYSSDESNSDDSDRESSPTPNSHLSLSAKVQRNDSLARFLRERPQLKELFDKNIMPSNTNEQRKVEREEIESKLDRKLSLRPTPFELEQRNILHTKSQEEINKEKEETKKMLVRKLSYRPTIQELKDKRIIRFCDYIEVTEVEDYDRRADKPWTRLTPKDKAAIRNELNLYKSTEMEVHEESRHLIRFHKP